MCGESLGIFKISETGLRQQVYFFSGGTPACNLYKLDRIRIGGIRAGEQRMIPCSQCLCKVLHKSVGALLRHIHKDNPSVGIESGINFIHNCGKVGDIARTAVKKN